VSEPASHLTVSGKHTWKMPPLILHPFSDASGPNRLVESSRASMMLQGLLPNSEFSAEELDRRLLDGRFCEIRMLFYVGKDLTRWLEQCMDLVNREPAIKQRNVKAQSFATLLVEDPPESVKTKLRKWGVADYRAIFSRALGINSVFSEVPTRTELTDEFIRQYFRYADQLYACYLSLAPHTNINALEFQFELYASGEYSRLLEKEWTAVDPD
jgi:hypothetical protein